MINEAIILCFAGQLESQGPIQLDTLHRFVHSSVSISFQGFITGFCLWGC